MYDYLFYIDMDTIIMNADIKLESFIDASERKFDVVVTEDMNGMNTGVFLMRNSAWTLWFLQTAWEQTQLVPKLTDDGKALPFRWEQRAFHYLTRSAEWTKADLPVYSNYTEVRKHFYMLPQCAFNSYILHPFDLHADREASQYAPGDFLIHFAGKSGVYKKQLMQHYLEQLSEGSGGSSDTGTGSGGKHYLRA